MRQLPGSRRVRVLAAAGAAVVSTSLLLAAPAWATPAPAQPGQGGVLSAELPGPEVPTLDWTACRDGFQCAKAAAPVDYDRP
jgi:hypothetical protein